MNTIDACYIYPDHINILFGAKHYLHRMTHYPQVNNMDITFHAYITHNARILLHGNFGDITWRNWINHIFHENSVKTTRNYYYKIHGQDASKNWWGTKLQDYKRACQNPT